MGQYFGSSVIFLLIALCFLHIHGQPDNLGFISVDCGYTTNPKYIDGKTGITYVADVGFTDAGLIHTVNPENMQPDLAQRYTTVRFFPNGTRNCYTLRSLTPGSKYLIRGAFGYGNYDTLNRLPAFDLYLGVNYWNTVNITNASTAYLFDMIAVSPADYLQVCLVNIGSGTPFISGLDLRSLPENLYPEVNAMQSLALLSLFRETVGFGSNRYHFGQDYHHIRYPDDRYDRIWQKYEDNRNWTDIPVSGVMVQNSPNDTYNAPSSVMRSVSTPVNNSWMGLWWSSDSSMNVGARANYFLVLYFAELMNTLAPALRQFDVVVDNDVLAAAFSPKYLLATVVSGIVQGSGYHNLSLVATPKAIHQPLISAMEIYLVRPLNESATDSGDASAMMTIQSKYYVKSNWAGDPCVPKALGWDGLNCSYTTPPSPPRITGLNLSYSGLVGEIDTSFSQLKLLQNLDLSHNNLSGSIPDFLGQMPSLTFLDLSSNNLSGSLPIRLLERSKDGSLTLRVDGNKNLCTNQSCDPIPNQNKNKGALIVEIIVPIICAMALLLLVVVLVHWYIKNKNTPEVAHASNPFENRRFKYKELKLITSDFKVKIGDGGFGNVYLGELENRNKVAVKMRKETSSQGNKEFLAEARHLARVHHKSLVSLVGYCKDRKHLGLVYEYMDGGNLDDRLRGEASATEPLTWQQRLKIALDSADGLEYLHESCNPSLIHRDVKTKNILLTSNLEAKIADFGLTRAFSSQTKTHTTTQPAGTIGYLDPEYYMTSHLTEKSDVYSFGVVLLMLVTAQPSVIATVDNNGTNRHINVATWVRRRISEGEGMGSMVDQRIRGDCDIVSVQKVVELALDCTEQSSRDRPTMSEVVDGLREGLQLEISRSSSQGSSGSTSGISQSSSMQSAMEITQMRATEAR